MSDKHSVQSRVNAKSAAAFAVSGIAFVSLAAVSSLRIRERLSTAIGNERIVRIAADKVLVQHVLPSGFKRIRHYVAVLRFTAGTSGRGSPVIRWASQAPTDPVLRLKSTRSLEAHDG